jgi:hypothetical protein
VPEKLPDVARLLKALSEADCRHVLIGGMAAVLHGSPVVTLDCDVAIAFDEDNRSHVVSALRPFHPRPLRSTGDWHWDEKSIIGPWTLLKTDLGRVDLIIRLRGVDSFDGLYARSESSLFHGVSIRYASLEDLIAMKSVDSRAKDAANLQYLQSLRDELARKRK